MTTPRTLGISCYVSQQRIVLKVYTAGGMTIRLDAPQYLWQQIKLALPPQDTKTLPKMRLE